MLDAPDLLVITFQGPLDIGRYDELRGAFTAASADERPVLVDLRSAEYVDSTFLSELLIFRRRLERAGRPVAVLISTDNVEVGRTFGMANLTDRVPLFVDPERARASLRDATRSGRSSDIA